MVQWNPVHCFPVLSMYPVTCDRKRQPKTLTINFNPPPPREITNDTVNEYELVINTQVSREVSREVRQR